MAGEVTSSATFYGGTMYKKDKPAQCKGCALYVARGLKSTGLTHPDILFVGNAPTTTDINGGAFTSSAALLVKSLVRDIQKDRPLKDKCKIAYTYAIRCCAASIQHKVSIEDITQCKPFLHHTISVNKPKVVVCFGIDAAKAMGYTTSMKALRGAILDQVCEGVPIKVIVTFHPYQVQKNPGLVNVLTEDLRKALDLASGTMESFDLALDCPIEYDAVVASLRACKADIDTYWEANHRKLGLAVDTETTSLTPYKKEDRIIMVSLSWQHAQGLAYPWQHKDAPYTPEQYEHIKELTQDILSSDKVALIMYNAKFDVQWLRYRYGLNIADVRIDGLIFEHLLDEDKKGEYSLKTTTSSYFPFMGKYEEALHDILKELEVDRGTKLKEAKAVYKTAVTDSFVSFWSDCTVAEREGILAKMVDDKIIAFSDTANLSVIKKVKRKGVMVPTKAYFTKIVKLLSKVPTEYLPGLSLPEEAEVEIPPITFEDVPIDVLLPYAAIDALSTRMISKKQMEKAKRDEQMLAATNAKLVKPIVCKSIQWSNANLSMPLCHSIADMEYHGVTVDRDKIREYQTLLDEKIEESKASIYQEVGYSFNTSSSSPDLAKVLFENMKLPIINKTDKGAPSTNADTLKELNEQFNVPMLATLTGLRKMEKTRSTYLQNWLKLSEYDGKVHGHFNQTSTATYRLSSTNPNLQNVPFELKEAGINLKAVFVPDTPEYVLLDMDISNAEMRVLCAYSEDENLTKAFNEGMDLHCLTASGISEFSYDDIMANKEDKTTPHYTQRQVAKKVNFG